MLHLTWIILLSMLTEVIWVFVGAIVGGGVTYFVSKKLLTHQLEKQQAYAFISKNYLPLLGAVTLAAHMWKKASEQTSPKPSRGVALENFIEEMRMFEELLKNLMRSGTVLLIEKIDKKLSEDILELHHQIQQRKLRAKEAKNVPEELSFVLIDSKLISDLQNSLSHLTIPQLVKEYQSAMKTGFKPKDQG